MYWKTSLVIVLFIFLGCRSGEKPEGLSLSEGALIEPQELYANLGKKGLKVIDVRDAETFRKGHIDGAIQIGRRDIENTGDNIPGMRADAAQIARLFSDSGIETDDWLVLYDDRGSPEAARLWCILEGYGHERVKVLNGGLTAWKGDGYELTSSSNELPPTAFSWTNPQDASLWIDAEEIAGILNDPDSRAILIDTRTSDEYYGVRQKKNAERAGHIPGAIHLDWADLIEYHGDHRVKQKEPIQKLLTNFGITTGDTIILYCHSGVRSSLTTFVLRELLEYPHVRNYDGSWTAWSRMTNYPIESDSITKLFD